MSNAAKRGDSSRVCENKRQETVSGSESASVATIENRASTLTGSRTAAAAGASSAHEGAELRTTVQVRTAVPAPLETDVVKVLLPFKSDELFKDIDVAPPAIAVPLRAQLCRQLEWLGTAAKVVTVDPLAPTRTEDWEGTVETNEQGSAARPSLPRKIAIATTSNFIDSPFVMVSFECVSIWSGTKPAGVHPPTEHIRNNDNWLSLCGPHTDLRRVTLFTSLERRMGGTLLAVGVT